jgi:hypothetical protein
MPNNNNNIADKDVAEYLKAFPQNSPVLKDVKGVTDMIPSPVVPKVQEQPYTAPENFQPRINEINKTGIPYDNMNLKDVSEYYNALNYINGDNHDKSTPEKTYFKNKINPRLAEEQGFVYDPNSPHLSSPIMKGDPRFDKIVQQSKEALEPGLESEIAKRGNNWRPTKYDKNGKIIGAELDQTVDPKKGEDYYRHLVSVERRPILSDTIKNEDGTRTLRAKGDGFEYYKKYSDATEEPMNDSTEYKKWLPFNSLPQNIKDKYIYKTDIDKLDKKNQEKALKYQKLQKKAKDEDKAQSDKAE